MSKGIFCVILSEVNVCERSRRICFKRNVVFFAPDFSTPLRSAQNDTLDRRTFSQESEIFLANMLGGGKIIKTTFKETLMKRFLSIFMVLLAMALAMTAFISCKNDSDDDDEPSVLATYEGTFDGKSIEAVFYDDYTFKGTIERILTSTGTWTGDLSTGGTFTIEEYKNVAFTVSGDTITTTDPAGTFTKK